MKFFLVITAFLLLIACSDESSSNDSVASNRFNFDSATAIKDTVSFRLPNADSIASDIRNNFGINRNLLNVVVVYPPSTKQVIWYSIGHALSGSGRLAVTCTDNSNYSFPLIDVASVGAASNLLQAGYVRIDTSTGQIFSYKTPLRGF